MPPKTASRDAVRDAAKAVIAASAEGASNDELQSALTAQMGAAANAEAVMAAVNDLLASGAVQLFQHPTRGYVFKAVAGHDTVKVKGLANEELLVYQEIDRAGNKGIWMKDLRYKTNLAAARIQKILKTLETRQLVKAIKPVHQTTRKVYLKFDLEPDKELTGGSMYSGNQLDTELIGVLRNACMKLIAQKPGSTLSYISDKIMKSGLLNTSMTNDDVEKIIYTLILDGEVDEIENDNGDAAYRPAILPVLPRTPFTDVPCGICPVSADCTPGGPISPSTCVYYSDWLASIDF